MSAAHGPSAAGVVCWQPRHWRAAANSGASRPAREITSGVDGDDDLDFVGQFAQHTHAW